MSRGSIVIPNAFATAPASPATVPAVQLDQDFNALLAGFTDSSNGYVNAVADTGIANAYVVTISPAPTGYANGMTVAFVPGNTNTASSTLNANSLGSIPILTMGGQAVPAGYLLASGLVYATYYNGNFYAIASPSDGAFSASPTGGPQTTTFNCANLNRVAITYNATGANSNATLTINVTNVSYGTHFDVAILTNGSLQLFKWTGTDLLGNTITPINAYYPQGSTQSVVVNLISAGDGAGTFITYQGAAYNYGVNTTTLRFIAAFKG